MADRSARTPSLQVVQPRPGGNPLGFSLEFREQKALVCLSRKRLGPVRIDRLEMEIPEVSFPFDLEGGAEQFRHRRCLVRKLILRLDEADLLRALIERISPERDGVLDLSLRLSDGFGRIAAVLQSGSERARVSTLFGLESGPDLTVRLSFFGIHAFGWLPMTGAALLPPLARALAPFGFEQLGAGTLVAHPVRRLLAWLLPLHGWKVPDLSGLRLDTARVERGQIALETARYPDERALTEPLAGESSPARSRLERELLIYREGAALFAEAETALSDGRLRDARTLYRGRGEVDPSHPLAARRLLEIGLALFDRPEELEDEVRDQIAERADDPHLWLIQAALALRLGESERAGESYARAAELLEALGLSADAIEAYLRAGELLADGSPAQAVERYERVLAIDSDCDAAQVALAALYERSAQWYRALRVLVRRARRIDDPAAQADCQARMARIYLEHIGDIERARRHLDSALALVPDHLEALLTQAEVQRRRGKPDRTARLLDRVLELCREPQMRALQREARLRLARLWEQELGDPAVAIGHYGQILRDDPRHVEALYRTGQLCLALERLEQAADAFARLLELGDSGVVLDAEVSVETGLALGRLYLSRPDGLVEARGHFARVALLRPTSIEAFRTLEQIDRKREDWPNLVADLERLGELEAEPPKRLSAWLQAALICAERLHDPRRAEKFYMSALDTAPDSEEALEGLSAILKAAGRIQELAEVIEASLKATLPPVCAAKRYHVLGLLRLESLGDTEAGRAALLQAVTLDPRNGRSAERLLSLYREKARNEEFVGLLLQIHPQAFDSHTWAELWLECARIQQDVFGSPEQAIESYQKVLSVAERNLQALQALADLHFDAQNFEEARKAILRLFELVGESGLSATGRIELHRRLGLAEAALGDSAAALAQWERVLALSPEDVQAANEIASLLRKEGRFEELARHCAARAKALQGEAAALLHAEAAAIYADQLGRPDDAAAELRAAVLASPEGPGAMARLQTLEHLCAMQDRWTDVADAVRRRIALSPRDQRPALFMSLASLHASQLADPEGAARCCREALEVEPDYLPALLWLTEHFASRGDTALLYQVGRQALLTPRKARPEEAEAAFQGTALTPERRAALALATARAAWSLGEREEALKLYQLHTSAMSDRGYVGLAPEALERLEVLLGEAGRYEDLALLYRFWLRAPVLVERRPDVERALAAILFERLNCPDEAIAILSEALERRPDDEGALERLLGMLRVAERWEQLAGLLEDRSRRAPSEEKRLERLEALARLYQNRLHDPTRAIALWQQLLSLGHKGAEEALVGLLRQEGRYPEMLGMLRQMAEAALGAQAAAYWYQAGRLARDELRDRAFALEAFERAYEIQPGPESRDEALALLREAGPPERLRDFLVRSAAVEADPEARRRLFLEHAEVSWARFDDRPRALASLQQALALAPDEAVARRALSLAEELGDGQAAVAIQEALIGLADSPATAARRVFRLGRLYAEMLGDASLALQAYTRAADLDPTYREPLQALYEVHAAAGNEADLLKAKVRIAEGIGDLKERGEVLREAAALAFERLGDRARGLALLREAAKLVAEPIPIWLELADRLEAAGELAEAADALEKVVSPDRAHEMADGRQTPAGLFRRIAALRQKAGDEVQAIAAYERTLRQEPSDEETAERLASLYRARGMHEDLAQMQTDLANRRSGLSAADTWVAVAQNWQIAGDEEVADQALRAALTAAPGHPLASRMLAAGLSARKEYRALLELLCSMPTDRLQSTDLVEFVDACFRGISSEPASSDLDLQACRLQVRVDPAHLEALQRGAFLLKEAGLADEHEEWLRRIDAKVGQLSPEQRYELDLRLASIDFARGRTEEAEARLKRCMELRPDEPGPRAFLHKLYAGGKRFADRVELLLEEANRAATPTDRFERIRSAAQLLELELGDPEGAAELLEGVVEREPDRLEAWRKLAELHRLLNNTGRQRLALLQLAERTLGDERVAALRRATRLANDSLGLPEAREDLERLLSLEPHDTEALDRLLALDRCEGRTADLARHLGARAELAADPAVKAALLRERAQLLGETLGEPDLAIEVFERLRSLQPSDVETLARLYDLYRARARWPEAADALEKRIAVTGTERARAPLWIELAEIRRRHLDTPREAIEALRQAAALDPSNPAPLHALRALAVEQADQALLLDTLEALAAKAETPAAEVDLRRAVGLLCWSLKRRDDARRTFGRVLALVPEDLVARRFQARILAEQDRRQAAVHLRWLSEREDALPPNDLLLCRRMRVQALAEAEPDEQIVALEGLLALEPDAAAARALAELYRATGRRQALSDLLKRMAALEANRGDPAPWVERAELLLQEGQPLQAVEALREAVAIDSPERFDLALRLAQLERKVLEDGEAAARSLEIARLLRPDDPRALAPLAELYTSAGAHAKAADALARLLEIEGLEGRQAIALRLGQAELQAGRPEAALAVYLRAVELDPASVSAYERIEELTADRPSAERGAFYLRWASGPAAGARRPLLYLAAAEHLEAAEQEEAAVEALREVLRLDPQNRRAQDRLAPLLRRRSDHRDLIALLQQRFRVETDPRTRASLAFELGQLSERASDDAEVTAGHYETCLSLDPKNAQAALALADLRWAQSRTDEAAELYARFCEGAPPERRAEIAFRRANVAALAGDDRAAVLQFREACSRDPENPRAYLGLIGALGRLGLEPEAVQAIDQLVEAVPDPRAVSRALLALHAELGPGQAQNHLVLILGARQPEALSADLWIERADLLEEQADYEEAAASLRRALSLPGDHRLQVSRRLAELEFEHLGDEKSALAHFELALSLDPDSEEILGRLEEIERKRGDFRRVVELNRRLVRIASPEQKPGVLQRLGDAFLKIEAQDDARKVFEKVLELDPAHGPAFERIEQILARKEDSEALANFYLRWARSPAGAGRRSSLFLAAARQLERLDRVTEAVLGLYEALAEDAKNLDVLGVLARLLGQEQRFEDLLEMMGRMRALSSEPERRVALSFEMAQVCADHLEDKARAVVYLNECLDDDREHPGALELLAEIWYTQGDLEQAGALYDRLGERSTAAGSFLIAFRRGEIAETRGDRAAALKFLRAAISANPVFIPAHQRLIRLLLQGYELEAAEPAIQALLQVLPAEGFEDIELDLYRLLAEVRKKTLRFDAAAEIFRGILKRDPDDRQAVVALRTYYQNRRDWRRAADLLEHEIALDPPEAARGDRFEVLGDLWLQKLGDPERAEQAYSQAIQAGAPLERVGLKLWRTFLARGAPELVALGVSLLETPLKASEQHEIRRSLARAHVDSDPGEALDFLEPIIAAGQADLEELDLCAELAKRAGRKRRYVSLAGQVLEFRLGRSEVEPDAAVLAYVEFTQIYLEGVADLPRATASLARALELRPRDPDLLRRLGALFAASFDTYREAIVIFRELLGLQPSDVDVYRYLARLEAARGEPDRTACYYAGLCFLDPSDREAKRYLAYVGTAGQPERELSQAEWEGITLHPEADCLLQRIISAIAPYLELLFPANLGRFRLLGRTGPEFHPTVYQAAELSRWLIGGRPVAIVVAQDPSNAVWLESGPEPTIVLASGFLEQSTPPEVCFFVSREVVRVAMGCILPLKFSRSDLQQLLAILSKMVDPNAEPIWALPATATQYIDAIRRVIPQEVLSSVEPLIRAFALEPRAHDIDRWLQGISRTADRIGLITSGDLNAALTVLTRSSPAAQGRELGDIQDRTSLLQADQDISQLCRFAFSEPYFKLRQALGAVVAKRPG